MGSFLILLMMFGAILIGSAVLVVAARIAESREFTASEDPATEPEQAADERAVHALATRPPDQRESEIRVRDEAAI